MWTNWYIDSLPYLRLMLILNCIDVVSLYVENKLPWVSICNDVTWLFSSNVQSRKSTNRWFHTQSGGISMYAWMLFAHVFYITSQYTVLSFFSILCSMSEKKTSAYIYTKWFFYWAFLSLFFMVFFKYKLIFFFEWCC